MDILEKLVGWIWNWIDRVVCAALAIVFSLAPTYTDQYSEHLKQTKDVAYARISDAEREAKVLRLSTEVYLEEMRQGDGQSRDSLQLLENTLERYRRYEEAYDVLMSKADWWRPMFLATTLDHNLRTSLSFEPNLKLAPLNVGYGILGLTLGWLLMGGLALPFRRRKKKKNAQLIG